MYICLQQETGNVADILKIFVAKTLAVNMCTSRKFNFSECRIETVLLPKQSI